MNMMNTRTSNNNNNNNNNKSKRASEEQLIKDVMSLLEIDLNNDEVDDVKPNSYTLSPNALKPLSPESLEKLRRLNENYIKMLRQFISNNEIYQPLLDAARFCCCDHKSPNDDPAMDFIVDIIHQLPIHVNNKEGCFEEIKKLDHLKASTVNSNCVNAQLQEEEGEGARTDAVIICAMLKELKESGFSCSSELPREEINKLKIALDDRKYKLQNENSESFDSLMKLVTVYIWYVYDSNAPGEISACVFNIRPQ